MTAYPLTQVVEGMRPFLLPIFFYAGQVNAAAESTSLSSSQLVAVAEMRALLVWILLQLRVINRDQVCTLLLPATFPSYSCHSSRKALTRRSLRGMAADVYSLPSRYPPHPTIGSARV